MAESLTFYTNPQSRGQIARWMLEEVGAPYEQVILDYGTSMKAEDYLAINPMGKVPAIKHSGPWGDRIVTEGAAICAYLADAFPQAGLAPDLADRADYYRWLFFTSGPTEAAITNNFLQVKPTEEQQRMVGYGDYDRVVDVLENWISTRDYFAGDTFTAADVYAGSQLDWGVMFGTLPERDGFKAYIERIRARPAYKRAKEIDMALMPKPAG